MKLVKSVKQKQVIMYKNKMLKKQYVILEELAGQYMRAVRKVDSEKIASVGHRLTIVKLRIKSIENV